MLEEIIENLRWEIFRTLDDPSLFMYGIDAGKAASAAEKAIRKVIGESK